MIVVIIAGGSGTRLWPLSTSHYPKHLLRVNGDGRSLLQNTYERAKKLSPNVYVVPAVGHDHHVREQLPEVPTRNFVIEPARRGTAGCVIAALAHLAKYVDADEPIAILPADHYIRDIKGFVHSLKTASAVAKREKRIVLVGVEPDHPATGFGYIEKDELFDKKSFVFNVKSFKEKPEHEVAQKYVKSGNYLWNCGYFVASLNTFKSKMEKHSPHMLQMFDALQKAKDSEEYKNIYLSFESNAIDYALIEKVDDLLVVPASFDWMDLGSFSDLHKATQSDSTGNYVHGNVHIDDVQNSFIQNAEEKPLAVIGLDNVVVINTHEGIVVTRKDLSQKVGDIAKKIQQ